MARFEKAVGAIDEARSGRTVENDRSDAAAALYDGSAS